MDRKDTIEELFKQKLANHQVSVNPELWSSIASKIPTATSASVFGGMSLVTKAIIGISVAASVVGLGYLISEKNSITEKNTIKTEKKITIQNPIKESSTIPTNKKPSESEKKYDISKNLFSIVTTPSTLSGSIISEITSEPETIQSQVVNSIPSNTEQQTSSVTSETVESETMNTGSTESTITLAPTTHTNSNVIIQDLVPTEESSLTLVLPNIFTPNGDGNNDLFTIDASAIRDFSIVILNSSGIVVYQSSDSAFSWNGTLPTGDPVKEGNFIYYITGKDAAGKLVSKHSRLVIKN
jgi:gliding motility-associated-like protein